MSEWTPTEPPVIAHFVRQYYALTENWIHTQVKHMTRYRPFVLTWQTENLGHGWRPTYYALFERPTYEQLFNRAARRVLGYYPAFRKEIQCMGAKAIHAHFGTGGYYALPLAMAAELPLVTTFYGSDLSQLPSHDSRWRERYGLLFESGDRFLVEGPHMASQLRALGCPEAKISIQHLGIELDQFPFQTRCLAQGEPLRILVSARFSEKKGIIYAVEAFALMLAQGIDSRLTVIGDASPSEDAQDAKRQILSAIDTYSIADKVELRGMQPHTELKRAYYEHHVFLQPSVQAESGDNEGGAPVTLIEAAATGMPIVATNHCDISEVVQNGVNGLLAPERNSQALAYHLHSLVERPAQIVEMGVAGRRHAEARYDAKKLSQRLESIYDELVDQRPG